MTEQEITIKNEINKVLKELITDTVLKDENVSSKDKKEIEKILNTSNLICLVEFAEKYQKIDQNLSNRIFGCWADIIATELSEVNTKDSLRHKNQTDDGFDLILKDGTLAEVKYHNKDKDCWVSSRKEKEGEQISDVEEKIEKFQNRKVILLQFVEIIEVSKENVKIKINYEIINGKKIYKKQSIYKPYK